MARCFSYCIANEITALFAWSQPILDLSLPDLRPLGAWQVIMAARKATQIDRNKFRAEVRKLGSEQVFSMLDDAIELLPLSKLHKIAKKRLDLKRLRPDAEKPTRLSLLTEVKRFEKASLASEYYESFHVI
jgi:hypothetical protein